MKRIILSNGFGGYNVKNDAIVCFEELNPFKYDSSISDKWYLNRLESFYGSKRHFLIALAARKLEEEGFDITLPPIKEPKINWKLGTAKGTLGRPEDESYPFEYPYSIIRRGGTEDYEYGLYFSEELEVTYRHYFLKATEKQFKGIDKNPVSRITLLHFPTIFKSNLIINNEFHWLVNGFWSIDQFYKRLPNNYLPK